MNEKEAERAAIQQRTRAFLKAGGKIDKLPCSASGINFNPHRTASENKADINAEGGRIRQAIFAKRKAKRKGKKPGGAV